MEKSKKHPVFNPFKSEVISELVGVFEARELIALPPEHAGLGSGVYALYYMGDFKHYESLPNREIIPLYVGKAVIPGGRKGSGNTKEISRNFIVRRLLEHSRTIGETKNLNLEDFKCRWLTVVPHFVGSAEAILIDHYRPIWNCLVSGFGIHTPGAGRRKQAKSDWDTLHPGRSFATGLPVGNNLKEIVARIRAHAKAQKKI